ncbi:MAG TPA: alpha/beta hydrolase [Candidatus Paceibacterota bacterium]|jgi:hypothetical protein
MKQVIAIHGGESFNTYGEYLDFLKKAVVDLEPGRGWKSGLQEVLGTNYQVILPRMPNSFNAKYGEWSIWFEKYVPLLNDEVILIGHSLGADFLVKYLTENNFPKKIVATVLVAGTYPNGNRALPEFSIDSSLEHFAKQAGTIFLYHSKDDQVVPYEEVEKYTAALPNAVVRSFEDRGHFNQEEFPELVADIKSL